MAERRTRRRFMAAFKTQGVKRVLDGCRLLQVAAELGLSTEQLNAGSAETLAERKAEEGEIQRPLRS